MPDHHVLIFGDSFVAGVGDPTGLGWTGRVIAASFQAGVPLRCYPLGVAGHTSTQVATRWWAEAAPRISAGVNARVVFSFGANDATRIAGQRRVELCDSIAALAAVLDVAAEHGLPTMVIGPPPVGDVEFDRHLTRLDHAFSQHSADRGIRYVSVHATLRANGSWTTEAAAGDGAHPAAGGYAALAQLVLDGGWCEWLGEQVN